MKPRSVGIQAKDVDTNAVLRVVAPESVRGSPVSRFTITENLDRLAAKSLGRAVPKVVLAKLAKLVKQGLLDGCACGCRGDFELTDAGAERIGVKLPWTASREAARLRRARAAG